MGEGTSEDASQPTTSRLRPNSEEEAHFLSRIMLCFLTPLFRLGWKKRLEIDDIYAPLQDHKSSIATAHLSTAWRDERKVARSKNRKPSLRKTIARTYGFSILQLGILLLIEEAFHIAQPLFMGRLIRYFKLNNSGLTETDAYLSALGVALTALLATVIHHPYFYGLQKIGLQIKCAVSGLIVDKGVRLSSSALHKTTVGHIVNILSTDVAKFDVGFIFIHYMWVGPLILISYGFIIWQILGLASLAGFGVIVLLLPLQGFLGKTMGELRRTISSRADKRISVMSEILGGIKVIKMYSWEEAFSALVDGLRRHELVSVKRFCCVQSTMLGLFWSTGKLVVMGAAVAYVQLGNNLSADTIFVAAALFNSCRLPVTLFLPFSFHCLFEMFVATDRVENVLLLEEFGEENEEEDDFNLAILPKEKSDPKSPLLSQSEDAEEVTVCGGAVEPFITMENFTATWETSREKPEKKAAVEEKVTAKPAIENINLHASPGSLITVIGPVGSGKSSLLLSLLRETRRVSGRLSVHGQVAFCSQDACIFSATLKENVLFSAPFDERRYLRSLELSALSSDISALPRGDQTLVGDRGASLSGGQKARLALARALYRDADIYILDDPLSAVDASVARFLYDKCISEALRSKIVILATHQVHLINSSKEIIVMKAGKVVAQGSPDEIRRQHPEYLTQEYTRRLSNRRVSGRSASSVGKGEDDSGEEGEAEGAVEEEEEAEQPFNDVIDKPSQEEKTTKVDDMLEEQSGEGAVPWSVYGAYMSAMCSRRPLLAPLIVFTVVSSQILFVAVDWWLNRWCDASEKAVASSRNGSFSSYSGEVPVLGLFHFTVTSSQFETVFISLTLFLAVIAVARCVWFRLLQVDASRTLHKSMFSAIIHAPLFFFDSNPIGRILNRFSKDVSTMDDAISMTFFEFTVGVLNLGTMVGMVFILNPLVILPSLPILALFYLLRQCYLSTSRDIKRIEAVSRSPLFSHISAIMASLVTIRAFRTEGAILDQYHDMQNVNVAAFYMSLVTSRWFAIWIDWLVAFFITVVAFFCIFSPLSNSSGEVALMLVYAVQLTGYFSWLMRQSAELQNGMVSVERIVNYMNVESEGGKSGLDGRGGEKSSEKEKELLLPSHRLSLDTQKEPLKTWPSQGRIQLRDVWMRYTEHAEYVLKGVSIDVAAGEKIGVVGRTGAGKSSLLRALFRLTLPSRGSIIIDDVDTASVPLSTLRKSIAIIPQEPVLFVGNIRRNLDPFGEYKDDQLWQVLQQVELQSSISAMGGLDASVHEGGANLSVGQRQLVCLARALLRKTKILVIDEATANVDNKTDALIQKTIRSSFSSSTVLTIAHRLHTIMDSSRLLVLDRGEVRELGHAAELLSRPDSLLCHLVQETGADSEQQLRQMAQSAWLAQQTSPSS